MIETIETLDVEFSPLNVAYQMIDDLGQSAAGEAGWRAVQESVLGDDAAETAWLKVYEIILCEHETRILLGNCVTVSSEKR